VRTVFVGWAPTTGCSNFSAAQLVKADAAATKLGSAKFQTVQNEYSLLRREAEHDVLPTCSDLDVAFLPFFPLASGLLTGKYRPGEQAPAGTRLAFWEPREHQALTDDVRDQVEQLSEIAEDSGHSILDLAFSWLLCRPQVASVIAGATSPEQVRSNVSAASWVVPADVLSRVDALWASW
jgi:aryl-alcohol dehydrogenase-like predicted oxidoreductase